MNAFSFLKFLSCSVQGRAVKQAATDNEEGADVVETVSKTVDTRQRCDSVGAAAEEGNYLMKKR